MRCQMKKLLRNIILVNCVLISVCSLVGVMVCIVFGIGCLIFDEDMKRYLIGLAICIPVASVTCGVAGYLSDFMNKEDEVVMFTKQEEILSSIGYERK